MVRKFEHIDVLCVQPFEGLQLFPDLQVVQRNVVAVAAHEELRVFAINVYRSEMLEILVSVYRRWAILLHETYVVELNDAIVGPRNKQGWILVQPTESCHQSNGSSTQRYADRACASAAVRGERGTSSAPRMLCAGPGARVCPITAPVW